MKTTNPSFWKFSDMWIGEENPTGKLRWYYRKGSDRPELQQEWKIVSVDVVITYEWRTVPGIME
jgi:hypothetical protein